MNNRIIAFISQLALTEQENWVRQLSELLPDENIVLANALTQEQKQQCEIAIVANPDPSVVKQFTHLKWCQSLWAGVDSLLAAFKHSQQVLDDNINFKLSRLIDPQLAQTMSEAVLTWVLYFHRDMHLYQQQQNNAVWHQIDYKLASERTVGILGLGELGQSSALRLIDNGFNVIGWSRNEKHINGVHCISGEQGLAELAVKSDIVVCLLPLTPSTRSLINENFLQQLAKDTCIINFARGGVINTPDLLNALNNKMLAHAVLDVFDQEPLSSNSPLWQHNNITILPHISAPTHIKSASAIVADSIKKYRKTGQLPICVNLNQGY